MSTTQNSELSSRYDPQAIEKDIFELWAKGGFEHPEASDPGESFSIVIPPPNVTGYLHIGHALNNTLQDILTRWRRMQGRNTLWLPGTDHAGIATQHVVERKLREQGLDRRDMTREEFLGHIWEWKDQYGSRIVEQLKRLGSSCDWQRERFTMDDGLSRAVRTVFKRLFDEGLIYRGNYLVNWSPKLRTALSDDEVVYKELNGHLWHIRYPLAEGEGFIQVATTRPETMLGDTAVAVHPEDPRYTALHGKMVALPLTGRQIPVLPDGFVEREFGTGAVKVTPAHDPNDYEMGKRHDLEFINILNPDGTLNETVPEKYRGLDVKAARKLVVADLEAEGLLVKVEDHAHAVGHCYRSGCVVEPYMSKQWFVKMKPLCAPAIEAVKDGRVEFVPKNYENVYYHWMENVRDWCISRQLWWGHRIPVFECADCGHLWCEVDETPTKCPKCASAAIEQDSDVLDTWFSSALWPFSTLGWPEKTPDLAKYYPTSVLVTAHDIIFFWVARMIIMGLKFMDEVPFSKVVINPIVRDEHGKKMSKSSGTAIDPIEVIDEIGTDSLRLTMASYPTQSRHMSLSEKRFESMRNFTNKLWNAARFVLMNVEDLTAEDFAAGWREEDLALEDRWILGGLAEAADNADAELEKFCFDGYVDVVYKFIWNQYCDWYVELVKGRLYADRNGEMDEAAARSRRTAQIVSVTVLEHILRLLHPVAPFITEEIWQKLKSRWGVAFGEDAGVTRCGLAKPSIMVAPWPNPTPAGADAKASAEMELIMETIGRIRNIRGEMSVPPSMATDIEIVSENAAKLATLEAGGHFIKALTKVGQMKFGAKTQLDGFAAANAIEDVTIYVYIPEELREQERGRLDKEIARLDKGVTGAERKLSNEKFVSGAPEKVVQSERDRLAKMQTELASFRQQREALS